MEKRVKRNEVITARNRIEHAIFHLKQAGHCAELDAGLTAVLSAFEHLKAATLDVVYASTGATYDPEAPGNVRVGVTAHCACGNVFADDVLACSP